MSEAHKRRGSRPPSLNKPWEPWEDELVRILTRSEAATRTGRTMSAVKNRRLALKVPDGRSRAERVKSAGPLTANFRNLTLAHCKVDEVRTFVAKKQARLTLEERQTRHDIGDVYLWTIACRLILQETR